MVQSSSQLYTKKWISVYSWFECENLKGEMVFVKYAYNGEPPLIDIVSVQEVSTKSPYNYYTDELEYFLDKAWEHHKEGDMYANS